MGSVMRKRVRDKAAERPDEDSPELTTRDIARMRPIAEVLPDLLDQIRRSRGRPRQETTKQLVSLRLSRNVLDHFKQAGPGWQTRIDEVLNRHVRRNGRQAK